MIRKSEKGVVAFWGKKAEATPLAAGANRKSMGISSTQKPTSKLEIYKWVHVLK